MLGSGYPGVAQFGSALEWGSRGREFDSRHSDQKTSSVELVFFVVYGGAAKGKAHSFLLQNWAKFVKIWVAADRSGHPCRVLGLAVFRAAKPFLFPCGAGWRCRACNVFQAINDLRICHAVGAEPFGKSCKFFRCRSAFENRHKTGHPLFAHCEKRMALFLLFGLH